MVLPPTVYLYPSLAAHVYDHVLSSKRREGFETTVSLSYDCFDLLSRYSHQSTNARVMMNLLHCITSLTVQTWRTTPGKYHKRNQVRSAGSEPPLDRTAPHQTHLSVTRLIIPLARCHSPGADAGNRCSVQRWIQEGVAPSLDHVHRGFLTPALPTPN